MLFRSLHSHRWIVVGLAEVASAVRVVLLEFAVQLLGVSICIISIIRVVLMGSVGQLLGVMIGDAMVRPCRDLVWVIVCPMMIYYVRAVLLFIVSLALHLLGFEVRLHLLLICVDGTKRSDWETSC